MVLSQNGLISSTLTWRRMGESAISSCLSYFNGSNSKSLLNTPLALTDTFEMQCEYIYGGDAELHRTNHIRLRVALTAPGLATFNLYVHDSGLVQRQRYITSVDITAPVAVSIKVGPSFIELSIDERKSSSSAWTFRSDYVTEGFFHRIVDALGWLSKQKIWTGGYEDTGTLMVDLPMDECEKEPDGTVIYVDRSGNGNNGVGHSITFI